MPGHAAAGCALHNKGAGTLMQREQTSPNGSPGPGPMDMEPEPTRVGLLALLHSSG
jgi:hypothetical protein